MLNFNIDSFIRQHITTRNESFFAGDIAARRNELKDAVAKKSILVIGGGGTIGSNFIKSILQFEPAKVVVIDTNENSLTELVRDIRSTYKLPVPKDFITYPVSLGDRIFEKIYSYYKPFDIIANFAAHKHVRSEKDVFSVEAMVQNNLFNAYRLLKLIEEDKPSHFFCVSTDKAANPVNIMGASKKLMEDLVMSFSTAIPCTTARFANVAFSNGSLLDGFIHRLLKLHPLSVPANIKRYFVSPEESGDICMLACVLGETGDTYFPKLNEDQLTGFLSITEKFLIANGYQMEVCSTENEAKEKSIALTSGIKNYPVYVFESDTTGEKLFEEFYTENEDVDFNTFKSLGVIKRRTHFDRVAIQSAVSDLSELFKKESVRKEDVVHVLEKYIPNFDHNEKGVMLDSKM
jgi:FlaA1/EpsC-like NDP-sugar epimerase